MIETTQNNRFVTIAESWFIIFLLTLCNLGVAFFVWHLVSYLLDCVMGPTR